MEIQIWEYSFMLHTCRLGDRVRKVINPFTRLPVEFPLDEGLSAVERNAVRGLFTRLGFDGPQPEGEGYLLHLPGNALLRLRCDSDLRAVQGPPLTGFNVEIAAEQLSDDLLTILLDIARQGNLAFMSSSGDQVRLVGKSEGPKVRARWPDAAIMSTTDALRSWLQRDIRGRKIIRPKLH